MVSIWDVNDDDLGMAIAVTHSVTGRSAIIMHKVQARNPQSGAIRTCISAGVPYRRYDYFFQREQSSQLRDAAWEGRIKPFKPWKEIAAIGLVGAAGVAIALAVL